MQRYISTLSDTVPHDVDMRAYPQKKEIGWTIKNFGPFPVPTKGQVIQMSRENWLLYHRLIFWEQKQRPTWREDGYVYLNDSLITSYSFEKNYFFMAGELLRDSQDSRYWGALPEEFIVGRADYVWWSKDARTNKIRWNRFMKRI